MARLPDICTKNKLQRSNYYSDTYRVECTLDGIKKVRDITHISIPFSPEKEIALKHRFGLKEEDLNQFYEDFGKNVQHHKKMLSEIQSKSQYNLDKSTAYIEKMVSYRKENGNGADIYILSDPMEPFVGPASIITDDKTTLYGVLDTGMRLLQTIKNYNESGICVGNIDLGSFYITPGEDNKSIVKDGSFFCALGSESPVRITQDAMTHMPDNIRHGSNNITPDTDMYVLCSLLWSLLDGKHYSEAPDLSHNPRFSNGTLTAALQAGMSQGASVRKELGNELRLTKKTFSDKIIDIEPPSYQNAMDAALSEYRKLHVQLDNDDQENQDDEDTGDEEIEEDTTIFLDTMTKKQKAAAGIVCGVLAAAVVGGSFFGGKILGEQGWGITAPRTPAPTVDIVIPVETETPAEPVVYTPAPAPTYNPVSDAEYPVLTLDTEYNWFRSEYPATDFCAILFTDSYEISDEIIERWNFYIENDSVICYVYKRPQFKTDVICNNEGGDKVLVISGNGAGKMKVDMRQNELHDYLSYKFSYGELNGLSSLISTGSTPFIVPIQTPVPTATPVPDEEPEEIEETPVPTPDPTLFVPEYPEQNNPSQSGNYNPSNGGYNSGSGYNGGGYNSGSGYNGGNSSGSNSTVTVPNWNDPNSWAIGGDSSWGTGSVPETAGYTDVNPGSVSTYNLVLIATNCVIHVGETTEVYNAGNTGPFVSIESSNMQAIDVSSVPDNNGRYRVTGLNVGSSDISVVDQYGQTCRITIQCIPNN